MVSAAVGQGFPRNRTVGILRALATGVGIANNPKLSPFYFSQSLEGYPGFIEIDSPSSGSEVISSTRAHWYVEASARLALEAVAEDTNGNLYHWQYTNAGWTQLAE